MAVDMNDQKVQLGCGTLFLIAIIVMFFSQGNSKEVQHDMRELRSAVADLKKMIESQSVELRRIRDRLPASVVPNDRGRVIE